MALLEVGEISSGRAAQILSFSRIKMIEMMNQWGIYLFESEFKSTEFLNDYCF